VMPVKKSFCDKDDTRAYAAFKEINAASALSDTYYGAFDSFITMPGDKSSYVRTRGFYSPVHRPELCCSIRIGVESIDLSAYKDSMWPLIQKDMDLLLKEL